MNSVLTSMTCLRFYTIPLNGTFTSFLVATSDFLLLQYDDPSQSIQRVLHPQLCALSLFKPPSISIFSQVEITLAVCNLLRSPRKWVPGPRSSVAGNMLGNVLLARSMGRLAMSSGVRSVWYQSLDMISVFGILEG
ncbi:hypothetical protein BDZ91DRAFT_488532 [Kalaharituber pfeilii]|nr:hypothetical protein BDZ91DRAFT_488532 [Kalaharituber pfeilii]